MFDAGRVFSGQAAAQRGLSEKELILIASVHGPRRTGALRTEERIIEDLLRVPVFQRPHTDRL